MLYAEKFATLSTMYYNYIFKLQKGGDPLFYNT